MKRISLILFLLLPVFAFAQTATQLEMDCGDTYEVLAVADEGWQFVRWSDGETANPRTLTATENATFTAVFAKELSSDIVLQENENADYYTQFAADYNGRTVNTATLNRQFTQGKWETLCLPFNVSKGHMMSLGLSSRVFEFRYAETEGSTITVHFAVAQSIEAGKGYIVNANSKLAKKESFVFPNAMINTSADNENLTALTGYNDGSGKGSLYLVGTLRTGRLTGSADGSTYLGLKNNKIYYPNSTTGTAVRAYRGIFRSDVPVNAQRVRIIADGEEMGELIIENGELIIDNSSAVKYINNGILYINRNGKTYNAQGQVIEN